MSPKLLTLCLLLLKVILLQATSFHVDPINGSDSGNGSNTNPWKTIENVIDQNLIETFSYRTPYLALSPTLLPKNSGSPIQAGDSIILYSGLHGAIELTNYVNTDYITVLAAPNNHPVVEYIHIQAGRNWIFKGLQISTEPYGYYLNDDLVHLESHGWQGPTDHITLVDCSIYSAKNPWTTISEWLNQASDGIQITGDSIDVLYNEFRNIRFGVSMSGDYINVVGNSISNFSADGIRLLGSNNLIEGNIIKNCYKVDENHDDGIQAFTTGGILVNDIIIRKNFILNYEDPNQPLLGDLQGIGGFDGPYVNWIVENNIIVVNHWHGISMYGLSNGLVVNNTVVDISPNVAPGPSWIKIADEGANVSTNCVVKNNIANDIVTNPLTISGNNTILQTYSDYDSNFVDYTNHDYQLLQGSIAVDQADVSVAPTDDFMGNARPSGLNPDNGAYEYIYSFNRVANETKLQVDVYPNPFSTELHFNSKSESLDVLITDLLGNVVYEEKLNSLPHSVDLNELKKGFYLVRLQSNDCIEVLQFVKE